MPAEAALSEPLEDALARLSSIPAMVAQPVGEHLAKHARHAERYSERLFGLGACTMIGFARAQAMVTPLEAVAWAAACGIALWFVSAHRHHEGRVRTLEKQLARARARAKPAEVAASFELVEVEMLEGSGKKARRERECYVAFAPSAGGTVELLAPNSLPAPPPLLRRHVAVARHSRSAEASHGAK